MPQEEQGAAGVAVLEKKIDYTSAPAITRSSRRFLNLSSFFESKLSAAPTNYQESTSTQGTGQLCDCQEPSVKLSRWWRVMDRFGGSKKRVQGELNFRDKYLDEEKTADGHNSIMHLQGEQEQCSGDQRKQGLCADTRFEQPRKEAPRKGGNINNWGTLCEDVHRDEQSDASLSHYELVKPVMEPMPAFSMEVVATDPATVTTATSSDVSSLVAMLDSDSSTLCNHTALLALLNLATGNDLHKPQILSKGGASELLHMSLSSLTQCDVKTLVDTGATSVFLDVVKNYPRHRETALDILASVVTIPLGRKAVMNTGDGVETLVGILAHDTDLKCQERAVGVLLAMAHHGYCYRQAIVRKRAIPALLELSLLGSAAAQKRAVRVLELLRGDRQRRHQLQRHVRRANVTNPALNCSVKGERTLRSLSLCSRFSLPF